MPNQSSSFGDIKKEAVLICHQSGNLSNMKKFKIEEEIETTSNNSTKTYLVKDSKNETHSSSILWVESMQSYYLKVQDQTYTIKTISNSAKEK